MKLVTSNHGTAIQNDSQAAHLRGQILALESAMLQMKSRQIEFDTRHHFAGGVYAREIRIPKGATLVGKIHKFEHINIISQGDISVVTDEGIKRIKAPATIVSPPGVKRVGYAHEDTIWTTIHATQETNPDIIEQQVIAPTFADVPTLETRHGWKQAIGGWVQRLLGRK
jgi:hypothetical protein